MTLIELARRIERMAAQQPQREASGLRAAGAMFTREARSLLGTYQPQTGPFPRWADLAPATIAARIARGYPGNNPLLVTGELRDSIGFTVRGRTATVGSFNLKARWHEFGLGHNPPRPFLGPAVIRRGQDATDAIAQRVFRWL